jgi:FkbM family methyltransferase
MGKHNFTIEAAPALMAYLERAGITLVDVGGRGGAVGSVTSIAAVAHYVTCEPEEEEAKRLAQSLPDEFPWKRVTVVPEGIGTRTGTATLYITRAEGMSSLLEPNPEVTRYFYLAGKFAVSRTATIPIVPLDHAAAKYGFTDACFLKIDTQGTELDILQSGDRLVRESLMGVYVEVSFRPIYKDQPLYGDVDAHLRARGFDLFMMNRTNIRRAGYRAQYYSKRMTTWAHCLYLREPRTIPHGDRATALPRLLALAMCFRQYDLAFEVVTAIRDEGLLPAAECTSVAAEVERVIAMDSASLAKKAQRRNLDENVFAPALRDRRSFE